MKILIITTYYPPDTAIAAVRPYMLAKYLSKMGHTVTVLRSGEVREGYSSFFENDPAVRVISYLGDQAPAERYQRGQSVESIPPVGRRHLYFLPEILRAPIAKIYHFITRPVVFRRMLQRIAKKHELQKSALDTLQHEQFDVVFSTFGLHENIYAGEYAAKLFSCPWIQDFRDTLAAPIFQNKRDYAYWKQVQDETVQKADACTAVSEGVLRDICGDLQVKNATVLYNGYEPTDEPNVTEVQPAGQLSFCYTGQMYGDLRDFSPLLKALQTLSVQEKISLDKVRIHYAGKDFPHLFQQAAKFDLTGILVDHGYVGREEAVQMQAESDIFTVLSWNTAAAKGILTGKFYEGIRAGKPILSIVGGNVPCSELALLNDKYHYGFCYESCREKEQFQALCDFLYEAYTQKINGNPVKYHPEPELFTDFRYDILAKQLSDLCEKLVTKTD